MIQPIAMDFLNSVRRSNDRIIDRLGTGEGLLAWLEQTQLVPTGVLDALRTGVTALELDEIAARARVLREWFRAFVHTHWGRTLQDDDLEALTPLNALLERDEVFCQLVETDAKVTGLDLQVKRRWDSPESLLVAIAQALAAFVCEADFSRIELVSNLHRCNGLVLSAPGGASNGVRGA